MKIKQKAYCILWTDSADNSTKIDYADAHTFNDCPCVDPTNALAVYKTRKDAIDKKRSSKEYKIVSCTIIINKK